jgi:hypothetical protein
MQKENREKLKKKSNFGKKNEKEKEKRGKLKKNEKIQKKYTMDYCCNL